jgi:hypothetical protein
MNYEESIVMMRSKSLVIGSESAHISTTDIQSEMVAERVGVYQLKVTCVITCSVEGLGRHRKVSYQTGERGWT